MKEDRPLSYPGHLTWTVALLLVSYGAFRFGRFVQHNATGRHYEVRKEEVFKSPAGRKVFFRYVTDHEGLPFLDAGNQRLIIQSITGAEVQVYDRRISFTDNNPWINQIEFDGEAIIWDDGYDSFHLTVERSKKNPSLHPERTTPEQESNPSD